MYWIPYGTVRELRKLGVQERKSTLSNRIIPCIDQMEIVDNGFLQGHSWRFIKVGIGHDFNFGSDYLPIKIELHDGNDCSITNNKKEKIIHLSMDKASLLAKVFRAFYPNEYDKIQIKDHRLEVLESEKQQLNQKKQMLLDELDKKIQVIEERKLAIQQEIDSQQEGKQ